MSAKHRISFDLSSPVKIFGMTKYELMLAGGGLMLFGCSKRKIVGIFFLVAALGAVFLLKQFKKRTVDFNVKAWLWWHLGIQARGYTLPPSKTRRIG